MYTLSLAEKIQGVVFAVVASIVLWGGLIYGYAVAMQ